MMTLHVWRRSINPNMDKWLHPIMKCGMKLLIYSQKSTVQVIPSHTLLGMVQAMIKDNPS